MAAHDPASDWADPPLSIHDLAAVPAGLPLRADLFALQRAGDCSIRLAARLLADGPLGKAGACLRGHEFHYATLSAAGSDTPLVELTDGETIAADTSINEIKSAKSAKGSELGSLVAFLSSFESSTGIGIDLRPHAGQGAFNEISTVVRQKIDRQRNEAGEITLDEPPSITALAALVAIMAAPQKNRDEPLGLDIAR